MKLLILVSILSFTAMANDISVNCTLNGPIVVTTPRGAMPFQQAQIRLNNLTRDGLYASGYIQDRFGPNQEFFHRLWKQTARCSGDNICLGTDFSWSRGLTFNIPSKSFEKNYYNFSMRIRNNRNNRTYFARCNSRN